MNRGFLWFLVPITVLICTSWFLVWLISRKDCNEFSSTVSSVSATPTSEQLLCTHPSGYSQWLDGRLGTSYVDLGLQTAKMCDKERDEMRSRVYDMISSYTTMHKQAMDPLDVEPKRFLFVRNFAGGTADRMLQTLTYVLLGMRLNRAIIWDGNGDTDRLFNYPITPHVSEVPPSVRKRIRRWVRTNDEDLPSSMDSTVAFCADFSEHSRVYETLDDDGVLFIPVDLGVPFLSSVLSNPTVMRWFRQNVGTEIQSVFKWLFLPSDHILEAAKHSLSHLEGYFSIGIEFGTSYDPPKCSLPLYVDCIRSLFDKMNNTEREHTRIILAHPDEEVFTVLEEEFGNSVITTQELLGLGRDMHKEQVIIHALVLSSMNSIILSRDSVHSTLVSAFSEPKEEHELPQLLRVVPGSFPQCIHTRNPFSGMVLTEQPAFPLGSHFHQRIPFDVPCFSLEQYINLSFYFGSHCPLLETFDEMVHWTQYY